MELIKAQSQQGLLCKREWWQIGLNVAIVAYGDSNSGISILNEEGQDITQSTANALKIRSSQALTLTQTIDAFIILCSKDNEKALLKEVESLFLDDLISDN